LTGQGALTLQCLVDGGSARSIAAGEDGHVVALSKTVLVALLNHDFLVDGENA
jgi:hypothetical protein